MINIAGEHTNQSAIGFDEISSLKSLTVSIRTVKKQLKIVLQAEGRELKIDFQKGISKVVVPGLMIHSILRIMLKIK